MLFGARSVILWTCFGIESVMKSSKNYQESWGGTGLADVDADPSQRELLLQVDNAPVKDHCFQ